jgi:hypothetical protein
MFIVIPILLIISTVIWTVLHLLPRKYGCIKIRGRSFSIFTLLTWIGWILLTITMGVSSVSFLLKDVLGWPDEFHAVFVTYASTISIVLLLIVWLVILGPSYSNNRWNSFFTKAVILSSSMMFTVQTFAASLTYYKR